MTEDAAFYDRAIRRMERVALLLAAAAVVFMAVREGWRGALGAAGGAAFSLGSFRTWKNVAAAVGGDKQTRPGWKLLIRFGILAAALLVIIRTFGVSPASVVAGLFVSVAAVLFELACELILFRS